MPPIILSLLRKERDVFSPASSAEALLDENKSMYWCRTPYQDRPVSTYKGRINSQIGGELSHSATLPLDYPYGPVDIYCALDVYYFPEYGVIVSQNGDVYHSAMEETYYFSKDLARLPHIENDNGTSIFTPPDDIPSLDSAIITFPWGAIGNYGHFLLDCLSGLSVIRDTFRDLRDPYVFPALKSWHVEHLDIFGVDYKILDAPVYHIKRVIFSSCMGHFLAKCTEDILLLSALEGDLVENVKDATALSYLSRKGNPKRQFKYEEKLEEILESEGFSIIQPEHMRVKQQIAKFSEARVVVGNTGAAFANIIYCKTDTIVIEVQPRGMHSSWVRQLCLVKGLKWNGYFVDADILNVDRPELGLSFKYNLEQFWTFVKNLIREQGSGRSDSAPIALSSPSNETLLNYGPPPTVVKQGTAHQNSSEQTIMTEEQHLALGKIHDDLTGMWYTDFIKELCKTKGARRYVEIGVNEGKNIAEIECDTVVGIDPNLSLKHNVAKGKRKTELFQVASDVFFRDFDLRQSLGGDVDVAFLDGMHLFEYLLRDFRNIEKYCAPDAVILMHDCLPTNFGMTTRDPHAERLDAEPYRSMWTGDVWKIIPILRKYRPDLRLTLLDCAPTGLVAISNVNPSSSVLNDRYLEIIDEYRTNKLQDSDIVEMYRCSNVLSAENVIGAFNWSLHFSV